MRKVERLREIADEVFLNKSLQAAVWSYKVGCKDKDDGMMLIRRY